MSGALVSVVIPNHNHARYVGDAIGSALAQDHGAVEVIVVDDGSSDESAQLIERFAGRVRCVTQEHLGLPAARNRGLAESRGDYVVFLDADDLLDPRFASALVARLEADSAAGAVFCAYRFVDPEGRLLPERPFREVPADLLHTVLLDGNFLVPESVLARRRCYDEAGGFDATLLSCADWDMWLRLSRRFAFTSTSQVLVRHRVVPGSMSSDPARMLRYRQSVLEKHLRHGDDGVANEQRDRAFAQAYLRASVEFLQAGDGDQAYECLRAMAQRFPPLLGEIEPYYELGCGGQPKGSRGHLPGLDVGRNGAQLLAWLDRLCRDPELASKLAPRRDGLRANAYLTLGRLACGAGRFAAARAFLWQAARSRPSLAFERGLLAPLVRSLVGGLRLGAAGEP